MILAHFRGRQFQHFFAAVLVLGVFLFSAVLATPPRAAGSMDCELWLSVCITMTFAQWFPNCLIACFDAYVFCTHYFQE